MKPVLHGINKPIPRTCAKELNPAATQNNILTNKGSVIKLASSLNSNSSLTQAAETPFLIQAADSLSAPVNISSQSVSVKNSEATITLTKPSPTIQSTINSSVIRYSSSSSNIIQPIILPQVQSSPLPKNNEDLSKNSKVVNLPNYDISKEKPLIAENIKNSLDIEEIHQTTNKIENKSTKRKTGI